MRKVGLVFGLALIGFACADGVGEMLTDAGQMIEDAGTSMQDGSVPDAGAQDVEVSCDKSQVVPKNGYTITYRWAEYEIDPGVTGVTTCRRGDPDADRSVQRRDQCWRFTSNWIRGTSTGWTDCGQHVNYDDPDTPDFDVPDPISITVHR